MTHECRYCSQPGATVPRYSIISKGKLIVIGYVHDECVRAEREAAARRRKAKEAKKWEKAGQQTLGFPTTTSGRTTDRGARRP